MLFSREKDTQTQEHIKKYIKSKPFQKLLVFLITVLVAFVIIESGAAPKKYNLVIGAKSSYDINAPRDIINKVKSEEKARAAADAVEPVMVDISKAAIEVLVQTDDFFTTLLEGERKRVEKELKDKEITPNDKSYKQALEAEQEAAVGRLAVEMKKTGVPLSNEQIAYLVGKVNDEEMAKFKKVTKDIISGTMAENITRENLAEMVNKAQNAFQGKEINQEMINIGGLVVKAFLKPNKRVNEEMTKQEKDKAADKPDNIVRILKDERIISYGETVTEDKFEVLKELNLLETTRRFDYALAASILAILLLLALILILYLHYFSRTLLYNGSNIVMLSVIIMLTLLIARVANGYSPVAIPVCIAAMSVSILLDVKLAGVVNFILSIAISFITKGDLRFIYMAMIGGTIAAFLVSRTYQRSRLSLAGFIIGATNVLIIVCIGIINKSDPGIILKESLIGLLNGIFSIILTIGMLPFWESTFNVVTPLKLLELANPNQPLIKRLLMEAPGTYHHSLMVGNLAEVATEAIGGNALLARVGAYFHDVGKLKRPNFFKENQMADNPHDRMTANLSTLVITSHTHDGLELAEKHKIPLPIRDIIAQHHGTTLVAYFYHKAKKGDKGDSIKQENFRYDGPKPTSKEAAVVMLADSVEAAVRSMVDKTEGKIEGLVRKIIKDKLDDGQLDLCNLTLKDLDSIAKGFLHVLSGYFHEREEYPEVKKRKPEEETRTEEPAEEPVEAKSAEDEEKLYYGDFN